MTTMPSLSKQLRNFHGGGGGVATAAAIDSVSARLDTGLPVSDDEIADCLYAVAVALDGRVREVA